MPLDNISKSSDKISRRLFPFGFSLSFFLSFFVVSFPLRVLEKIASSLSLVCVYVCRLDGLDGPAVV